VIDDALAALPEDFRAPVVLRDHAGLDYAEIAEILDLAPGTVRSRIARGRRRLAVSLRPPPPADANEEAPDNDPFEAKTGQSDEKTPSTGNQSPPPQRQNKQP